MTLMVRPLTSSNATDPASTFALVKLWKPEQHEPVSDVTIREA